MAKKSISAAPVLTHGEHSIAFGDLSQEMVQGLVGLGFSTKLKNATAGLKPAILGQSKTKNWEAKDFEAAEKESGLRAEDFETTEAFADAYCAWIVAEEFRAIVDSTATFGAARGPRLKGLDWYVMDIAKAAWAEVKAKVPGLTKENEKEKFAAFVERNKERFTPAAREKMEADAKAKAEAAGLDLDL